MSKIEVSSATMTPREIVQELDRHIVGQHDAKRAVAIALRNRWRRMQLVGAPPPPPGSPRRYPYAARW